MFEHSSAPKLDENCPYPAIDDYGAIGDCRSAALVSCYGSIDWLCWPRFDSPSVFAGLLDRERGGYWSISPVSKYSVARHYIPGTNVLQTQFTTSTGSCILTDLMPVHESETMVPDHEVIRSVSCTAGEIEIESLFQPRAMYGEHVPRLRQAGQLGLRFDSGRGVYWLRSSQPFQIQDSSAVLKTHLRAGESLLFSFSYAENAPAVLPPMDEIPRRIQICIDWWKAWSSKAQYDGEFREQVLRSALALKLMIYSLSGAVVAAPTTSLPEKVGGSLNWDYRYCWLRDASLTIRALLELGYDEEASHFLDWMLQATRLTQPELHILYTVFGNKAPKEVESQVLRGYRGSSPVRIGNAARDQLQLDVYGEVIDAAAQFAFQGGLLDREMQEALLGFSDYVCKNWQRPDEGIWEPRSGRRSHTHSRLLCWTALDRVISLAEQEKLKCKNLDEYKRQRDAIKNEIRERCWNDQMQSYVSTVDGDHLDSSLLLLSWYGFEKPESTRMQLTYRAIRERLGTSDGLLYRYAGRHSEGTFALCSFWEAEFLALGGGSTRECRDLLSNLLRYRNDLGLFAEEIEPRNGEALGNFPQAFTHIGMIGAALSLSQREKGEKQLEHRPKSAPHADLATT